MIERNLFTDKDRLFESLTEEMNLAVGFDAVRKNKGSPGVDGQSISDFETKLEEELRLLSKELKSWSYEPQPVRRVEIPKPNGGVRLLGIPCVRDRVVQATIKHLLEPLLDLHFSDSSYGFRPGKNQEQAVKAARDVISTEDKRYIVDIDLSKFFDRINHDRLIHRLGKFITDKRILRLIGITLRSGVMVEGVVRETTEGSVQGSPLSPLLSNLVLDELDKELENRGLSFCRFADDCNIFVKTQRGADRVMQSISKFIEERLKLQVNREKSKTAPYDEVKFLGMTIVEKDKIAISRKSMKRAMEKIKELIPSGTHETLELTIDKVNRWYMGWASYYSLTCYPSQLYSIEAHMRRRFRSRFVAQQKRKRNLFKKLIKLHVPKWLAAKTVFSNKGRWALSHNQAIELAYPNRWFIEEMDLKIFSNRKYSHWLKRKLWIKLK